MEQISESASRFFENLEQSKEQPNYYAIIPANVRYAKITAGAKLLYAEISCLSNKYGFCYAKNRYFAELYNVTTKTISGWIGELVDNGFIESEIVYKKGSKEVAGRVLTLKFEPIAKKEGASMEKNVIPPMEKNVKDNNTSNNNTSNNTKENIILTNNIKENFDEFWSLYPKDRIGNKAKAYSAFCKVIKEKRATIDKLLASVKSYARSEEVHKGFAKGCAAWLNDDRFNQNYKEYNEFKAEFGFSVEEPW